MTQKLIFYIIVNVSYLTKGSDIIKQKNNVVYEIKSLDNMLNRKIINYTKAKEVPFILSPVQLKTLHYLYIHSNETIYQRDIEKLIESRRSTTSGILSTMEKNNIIIRLNREDDARSKQIILTEYGINISKEIINYKKNFDRKIEENITKEELEIFFKVTNKIKTNIINMK